MKNKFPGLKELLHIESWGEIILLAFFLIRGSDE